MDIVTTLTKTGRAPTKASAERVKCPLCPIGRQKTYSVSLSLGTHVAFAASARQPLGVDHTPNRGIPPGMW